jgi:hypothetical protein
MNIEDIARFVPEPPNMSVTDRFIFHRQFLLYGHNPPFRRGYPDNPLFRKSWAIGGNDERISGDC